MEISAQNFLGNVKEEESFNIEEEYAFVEAEEDAGPSEPYNSPQTADMMVERRKKKVYTCYYCEFSVEKFKYIKSHIKMFHITDTVPAECPSHVEPEPNVPSSVQEEPFSVSVPEPGLNPAPSQTKKFDMDLCPYCDFNDKNEKKLRQHILSKHSKELDKIIIYNYDAEKEQKSTPKKDERTKKSDHEEKPMSFSSNSKKSNKKQNLPVIKQETSDKNQNEIIPFTIQPDVETISMNNCSSAKNDNFKCVHCDYNTEEAWELMFHLSENHPQEIQNQESVYSGDEVIHEESIKGYRRNKIKAEKEMYYCEECKYTTHRLQLLNRHLMSKHNDRKPHQCHACDYATKRLEHLNRHILSKHSGEKPFSCQFCDYRASRDDHLRNHVLSKHAGEQLLRCVHCNYSALSTEHLNVHVLTKHSDCKPFMCQKCNFASSEEEELTKHMKESHSLPNPYSCELCPYSTHRLEHLNRHVLAVHSAERPYRCKLCEYSSARSEHLNYHMMSKHRDERPHVCTECEYRATRLSHLTRHIQSKHSGIKPYLCPHCSYRAGRMEHLHRHVIARHSENQPSSFSCYGCEFTTTSKDLLDHHLLSTHVEGILYDGNQFCDISIKEEKMDCDEITEDTNSKGDQIS